MKDKTASPQLYYHDHLKRCTQCARGPLCDEGRQLWAENKFQPAEIRSSELGSGTDLATQPAEEGDGQSSVSFTPGPWEVDLKVRGSHPSYLEVSAVHEAVWLARVQTYWDARKESEANARLIAAAPALYEVVRRFVEIHETMQDAAAHEWEEEKLIDPARAALASSSR